jgi:purine-binding chemotaxis protein CheW
MQEIQIVVFSLNNEICGADTSQVQEIIRYQDVAKVPGMPDFVDGIINLRGKVVPVIGLNKRFELGEAVITRKTKIITTRINESYVGFIVDDVSEIIKLSEEEFEVPPEIIHRSGNAYLRSVGKKNGMLISILNLVAILTDNEVGMLDEKELS